MFKPDVLGGLARLIASIMLLTRPQFLVDGDVRREQDRHNVLVVWLVGQLRVGVTTRASLAELVDGTHQVNGLVLTGRSHTPPDGPPWRPLTLSAADERAALTALRAQLVEAVHPINLVGDGGDDAADALVSIAGCFNS